VFPDADLEKVTVAAMHVAGLPRERVEYDLADDQKAWKSLIVPAVDADPADHHHRRYLAVCRTCRRHAPLAASHTAVPLRRPRAGIVEGEFMPTYDAVSGYIIRHARPTDIPTIRAATPRPGTPSGNVFRFSSLVLLQRLI